MDDTSGANQTPAHDDLTQAADGISNQVESAASGMDQLGDNLGRAVDDGLANAEKSLDTFLDNLDNFLGKLG